MSIRQKIKDIDNRGIVAIIGKRHTRELGLFLINLCVWAFVISPCFSSRVIVVEFARAEETSVAVVSPDSREAEASVIQGTGEVARSNAELASTPSTNRLEQMIRAEFGEQGDNAIAVARCESSLNPSRVGDKQMEKWSYGLFQINRTWHPYSEQELLDPAFNIKIAKKIYDGAGWKRWTCGRNLNLM